MSLHKINGADAPKIEDVYATETADRRLPRYRIPQRASAAQPIYNLVHDELLMDGNSRQNLATFCTTWSEPEGRQLMAESIDKNMIDKDEYPQTAEIENRCVHMIADLWHAPGSWKSVGCSTTGSSEACMLGGLALKWRWRKRRIAAGKSYAKPNFVCGPVQVCWEKFARYFDVEIRQVPLEGAALGLRPEDLKKYCDENTIGVVPTLGLTFTGIYEPVAALAAALDELQRETGLDIPIHVDAASGGFIAPFIEPELEWDFRIERVKSISASGPQIRAGAAWGRLGDLARQGGSTRRTHLQRRLSRRKHADLRAELQPTRRPDHRAILQFSAPRPRRLCGDPAGLRRHRAMARRRDRQAWSAGAGL